MSYYGTHRIMSDDQPDGARNVDLLIVLLDLMESERCDLRRLRTVDSENLFIQSNGHDGA